MRHILAKLAIGVALTVLAMSGADNTLGTWKRDVDKTKSTGGRPIKNLTTVREAADGGVKATSTGEYMDGTPIKSNYTAKYDGKEYPVTGAPWDTISIKQIDASTLTTELKKAGGKFHTKGRTVVSKDGKTMTVTSKGTNDEENPVTSTIVYDKQ